jgi:hypothetical protein
LIGQHSVDFGKKEKLGIYFWFTSLGNFPGVSVQAGAAVAFYDSFNI